MHYELFKIKARTSLLERRNVNRRNFKILYPVGIASILCLASVGGEALHVVLPILVIVNTSLWFLVILWNRDKVLPMFDIGLVCMAATSVYALYPLLMFLLAGGHYNPLSSLQLYILNPSAEQIGAFAWRYVIYSVSFAAVYLVVRGCASVRNKKLISPHPVTSVAFAILFLLLAGFFVLLRVFYGVDFHRSYELSSLYAGREAYLALPHFSRQIIHNLDGIFFISKLGLMVILMAHWHKKHCRYLLVIWIFATLIGFVFNMGARTEIMLILISFILLYHRSVRHLKASTATCVAISLLVVFLLFGLIRGRADLRSRDAYISSSDVSPLLVANEFEVLFAGNYDLYHMKEKGMISDVPWQVYLYEFLLLVPQQLLPFEKINPQQWYKDLSSNPSYFMFGPISQAVIGLGWIELVLRGALLGYLFGILHRWYVRKSHNFWRTLFYLWLMVWSFYTFRSSTFTFVYFIIYRFIPAMIIVHLLHNLLKIKRRTQTTKRQVLLADI